VDPEYRAGLAPEIIKFIIFPLLRGENMYNYFPEIQKYPAGFGISFSSGPGYAELF